MLKLVSTLMMLSKAEDTARHWAQLTVLPQNH